MRRRRTSRASSLTAPYVSYYILHLCERSKGYLQSNSSSVCDAFVCVPTNTLLQSFNPVPSSINPCLVHTYMLNNSTVVESSTSRRNNTSRVLTSGFLVFWFFFLITRYSFISLSVRPSSSWVAFCSVLLHLLQQCVFLHPSHTYHTYTLYKGATEWFVCCFVLFTSLSRYTSS